MDGITINLIFFVLGIAVLIRAGIYVVSSLTGMARFLGTSEFTISFILMAFATSLPELAVGINAAATNSGEISLGNILGTNVVNLTLVLGVVALIVGHIQLSDYGKFTSTRLLNFMLVMAPVGLLLDGELSRSEGVILLILFLWNITHLLGLYERFKKRTLFSTFRNGGAKSVLDGVGEFFKDTGIFLVSITFLMGASYLIVASAKNLSQTFAVPELLVGVFVVGLGTSLPELAFGIQSTRSGSGGMSLGNLFGSSVMNATLILGVTALIQPITVSDQTVFWISAVFMGGSMLLAYYFLRTKNFLVRKEGIILVFVYIIFLLVQMGWGTVQNTLNNVL